MDNLTKLKRALRKLEHSEGRVARNNARTMVRRAVRSVLSEMDRDYPVIPKQRKERAHRRLGAVARDARREGRLRRRGYVKLMEVAGAGSSFTEKMRDCAVAGIRVIVGPCKTHWVPAWVKDVPLGDVATLRRAKRNAYERKVALAEATLKAAPKGGTPP
jgi:hypothetical protein